MGKFDGIYSHSPTLLGHETLDHLGAHLNNLGSSLFVVFAYLRCRLDHLVLTGLDLVKFAAFFVDL